MIREKKQKEREKKLYCESAMIMIKRAARVKLLCTILYLLKLNFVPYIRTRSTMILNLNDNNNNLLTKWKVEYLIFMFAKIHLPYRN